MPDKYYNPFASIDVEVPIQYHEFCQRYSQTSQSGGTTRSDTSPFQRMVDLWFFSICMAVRNKQNPQDVSQFQTVKITPGSIFSSDPWRIHALMLIATASTDGIDITSEPRRMMQMANGLACAGFPIVEEMIKDGEADPIWNLSDSLHRILSSNS